MATEEQKNQVLGPCLPLEPGTLVENYRLGQVLWRNGESCLYEAISSEGKACMLREFLPTVLLEARDESGALHPKEEELTLYKYSMTAFQELYRLLDKVCSQKPEHLLPLGEALFCNNTLYIPLLSSPLEPLSRQLAQREKPYSWAEAKKALLPLLNCVAQLHHKGVVHLGICPENLFCREDGSLVLENFSTLEARSSDGSLDQELYPGYSSPEQYIGGSWRGGPQSDVYSLGALLYRLLTGETPPAAPERREEEPLRPPMELNPGLPESVSDAICGALLLDPELRSATVDDFTSALLESVSGNTTVYEVPTLPNEHTVHLEADPKKPFSLLRVAGSALLFLALTLALGFGAYMIVTENLFPQEGPSTPVDEPVQEEPVLYTVPDFVGHKYQDILANPVFYEHLSLVAQEDYSNSYPEGVVSEQSLPEGSQAPKGATITLTVSLGKELLEVPTLMGQELSVVKAKLDEAKIPYTVYVVENKAFPPNTVFRSDPPEGSSIDPNDGSTLRVYVTPPQTSQSAQDKKPSKNSSKDKEDRDD